MNQTVDPNSPAIAAAIEAADKFDGSLRETEPTEELKRLFFATAIQAYLDYRAPSMPTAFKRRDKVRHTIFGLGEVTECGESSIRIRFEEHGYKELMLAFAGPKLTRI